MRYGIFARSKNKFLNGWELLEQFPTEAEAVRELEEYYLPENEKTDDEEKCQFKIDTVK